MKKSIGPRTLIYPTPVFVIGTYDKAGKPNAMTAAWGGICCSNPPCVAVSLRRARYSFNNIVTRQAFTVNITPERLVKESDYFGLVSGRNQDKFAATGLTAVKSDLVDAPYIKEFPVALECSLLRTVEIGVHIQFIGEVLDIKADEELLNDKGIPDIVKVKPVLFAPEMQAYYGVGSLLGQAFSIGKSLKS